MAKRTIRLGGQDILLRCSDYLLDANLLIAARVKTHRNHTGAGLVLAQLLVLTKQGDVRVWVSPLVVNEVWWGLLRLHYDADHGEGEWEALRGQDRSTERRDRRLAKEVRAQAVARYGPQLEQFTDFVLSARGPVVAGVGADEIRCGLTYMLKHRVMPQDALHCSVMERSGIAGLVSNDRDFDASPAVTQRIPFTC